MRSTLDLSLFRWIESQTIESDRHALLSIKDVICSVTPGYRYLEVGSHLGGSLQPHVVDSRCAKIYSIDPRPEEMPDDWKLLRYEGNSTERMLGLLSKIPEADVRKIQTFETCSWDLAPDSIPRSVDLAFIDGEHTNPAVVRDYVAVRRFLAPTSILAFHDVLITPAAFLQISRMLWRERQASGFYHFPESAVVAIVFGSPTLTDALRKFGWTKGLPYTHAAYGKILARRHLPRVTALWRKSKKYLAAAADRLASTAPMASAQWEYTGAIDGQRVRASARIGLISSRLLRRHPRIMIAGNYLFEVRRRK